MHQAVNTAFGPQVVTLPLSQILPMRQVTSNLKQMIKYKRIAASICEVGLVEPLVVAKPQQGARQYMLLDGHLRHAALSDLGAAEAPCLVSDDDEAFTYNKRVNRLATVQEHYMIVRALERGVSEDKLARTLNVDIPAIKQKRNLLKGICPEVIERLKDRSLDPTVFNFMRKMKPMRQIEAFELMTAVGNFTARYAHALLAATKQQDLARSNRPKRVRGLTSEQMARMEQEMEGLQHQYKAVEASYGDTVLNLVVATGYLSKLLANPRASAYLQEHHPEFAAEFRALVSAGSLEDAPAQ